MANKYERSRLIPDQDVDTLLYLTPPATATICRSLRITNTNSTRAEITITQEDEDGNITVKILDQHVIAPKSEYDALNGVPLNLMAGDLLSALSTASGVHFYLSYVEVDRN